LGVGAAICRCPPVAGALIARLPRKSADVEGSNMLEQGMAVVVLALLPGGLGTAFARSGDPPKAQDAQLEGDWEAVSVVRDGKVVPQPDDSKPIVTIKGSRTTFKVGDRVVEQSLVVDTAKTPKTIDVSPGDGSEPGETKHGIYEIKDGILRICLGDPGQDRPSDFNPKEGSGYAVLTLKRIKK
jgi:uncharacterized protein (TIGR03067 family)